MDEGTQVQRHDLEPSFEDSLAGLREGTLYRFADWPVAACPAVAAGVYTIWRGSDLIYTGMAGRLLDPAAARRYEQDGKRTGLFTRLASHASGRRSGDQFCLYVCDRLVLPTLSGQQIGMIGAGELSLDRLVRDYIRDHLTFRYIVLADGRAARSVERAVQRGALGTRPLLNPL